MDIYEIRRLIFIIIVLIIFIFGVIAEEKEKKKINNKNNNDKIEVSEDTFMVLTLITLLMEEGYTIRKFNIKG